MRDKAFMVVLSLAAVAALFLIVWLLPRMGTGCNDSGCF